MRLWRVPAPVEGSSHDLKYSLFYGNGSGRVIAYDNERGKGDHKHTGSVETPYLFTSIDNLMSDFLNDVSSLRGGSI